MNIEYRNGKAFQQLADLGYELDDIELSTVISNLESLLAKYSNPSNCYARYISNEKDRHYPLIKECTYKVVSFDRLYLEKEYYGDDAGLIRLCGERAQLPEEISALAETKIKEDEERRMVRLAQFNKLKEEFDDDKVES